MYFSKITFPIIHEVHELYMSLIPLSMHDSNEPINLKYLLLIYYQNVYNDPNPLSRYNYLLNKIDMPPQYGKRSFLLLVKTTKNSLAIYSNGKVL